MTSNVSYAGERNDESTRIEIRICISPESYGRPTLAAAGIPLLIQTYRKTPILALDLALTNPRFLPLARSVPED